MNQQPDKLFRDKLEGYQRPAPASAWEKIAAAQSKKNDKWLWLKIAASIAFVAVAAYVLFPESKVADVSKKQSNVPAEEKSSEQAANTAKESTQDIKTEATTPSTASNIKPNPTTNKEKAIKKITPAKEQNEPLIATVPQPAQNDPEAQVGESVASVETDAEPQVEVVPNETKANSHITLTYSAKDVEEYLDKKSLAEATSDSKKSSTLKKLLKKAEDLTNNQDPFGELRQKKNEILALNFKNEKQRGQNK